MEWLSINFCDLCTPTRIDVEIARSDSMVLRDVPHDSSVTIRKTQNPRYITLSCLESHNLPANSSAPVRSYRRNDRRSICRRERIELECLEKA